MWTAMKAAKQIISRSIIRRDMTALPDNATRIVAMLNSEAGTPACEGANRSPHHAARRLHSLEERLDFFLRGS